MSDGVRCEADGPVLVVTIDRPERGGALRTVDMTDLAAAFAFPPDGTQAILLRSDGRHFCTGADLSTAAERSVKPPTGHMRDALARGAHALIRAVWECPVPVVVAVNGRADGLGCHLAQAADLVVCGRRASFSEPFALRGFSVDSGGSWLLTRRIGLARATRMLFLGESVDADTAAAWGLCAEVVADEDLDDRVRSIASSLAAGATLALSLTKRLLRSHASGVDLWPAMESEALAVELSIRSNDFKEGLRAFGERRSPQFTGR